MRALLSISTVFALTAMHSTAVADTWEKCFDQYDAANEFVVSVQDFALTRVGLKPLENRIFKNKSLNLDDIKMLFGDPTNTRSIGSIGDRIFEWTPLITRAFSATEVKPKTNAFCTYVSSRSVHHQLLATVDKSGVIVHRETRKRRSNN